MLDTAPSPIGFLHNDGECAKLMATMDWSGSLGDPADWPSSLKVATGLLLHSPVPMVMLWGMDGIMIYNDAYSVFAGGRHLELLGSKVREGWPEVAEFNDQVMTVGLAGGTLSYRNQELTLHRHGRPEQVWMNLDYSPVLDEGGRPGGVLAVVVETTAAVRAVEAMRQATERLRFFDRLSTATSVLSSPTEVMAATARLLGEQLGTSVIAYADMDPDEDRFTIRGDWAAPGSQSIVGTYSLTAFGPTANEALHEGRPFITRDTLAALGPDEGALLLDLGLGATVCIPLVRDGRLTALMAAHNKHPRDWTAAELSLIAETTERSWAHGERVRSEAILRESEERLRVVVDSATDYAIFTIDPERRITSWSQGAADIFGITRDEAIGRSGDELFTPEDRAAQQPEEEIAIARREGCAPDERWHQRLDGTRVFLNGSVHPLPHYELGQERGFIKVVRDETERRRTEAALHETAERYRLIAQATNDPIWDWDFASQHVIWNEAVRNRFGHDEAVGGTDAQWWVDHIHPEDRERIHHSIYAVIDGGGSSWIDEYRFLRADGSSAHVLDRGTVIRDDRDRAIRMIGAMLDLSERHEAEAALAESEATLRSVLEQMPIGVAIAEVPSGRLVHYNQACAKILGREVRPGATRDYGIFHAIKEDGTAFAIAEYPLSRAVMSGETIIDEEIRYRRGDGEIVTLEVSAAPIETAQGRSLAVTTFTDISARKRGERHQQLLIDELSHRAKNLLAIIQSVAQQSFKQDRPREEMVRAFEGRLGALAAAHGILTQQKWESAPLRRIICDTIIAVKADDHRLKLDGPELMVSPKTGSAWRWRCTS
ncbi:PAS domain S-box protein [uncultured Sphingomonas sp.]|uniref:PAS domain S-box protein n=1 Tax=uncultured Sphingomonas sp. TaxID=158754 RepID=UPI0025E9981D|nr:PAS domain S-box protein [uncultured Sphingomonas sp.]